MAGGLTFAANGATAFAVGGGIIIAAGDGTVIIAGGSLIFGLGRVFCHGAARESQEHGTRRRGTSFKHKLLMNKLRNRWRTGTHTKMMLRLDKDTGRTEDL